MIKTYLTPAIMLFTLCSILFLQACTLSTIVDSIAGGTRKGPKTLNRVQFKFSPQASLSIANDAEYFDFMQNAEYQVGSFHGPLKGELNSYNVQCLGDDSSRFLITVTSMSFSESTNWECQIDENQYEDCFLLNDLWIGMSMTVKDRLNKEEKNFSFNVSESSSIVKRLIGKGLTERTFGMNYDTLSDRLIKKAAGKAAKYIRKNT